MVSFVEFHGCHWSFMDCWDGTWHDPVIVLLTADTEIHALWQWFQMFIITTAPTPTYADSDHNVLLSLWTVENEYMRCFSQGLVELGWVSQKSEAVWISELNSLKEYVSPGYIDDPPKARGSPRNSVRHGRSEFSLVALKTREMRWRRRFTTSWKPWVWRRYEFCFSAQWEFLAPLWNHKCFCTHVH